MKINFIIDLEPTINKLYYLIMVSILYFNNSAQSCNVESRNYFASGLGLVPYYGI
jgi:hypothetical protein